VIDSPPRLDGVRYEPYRLGFRYEALPMRVAFGAGAVSHLDEELRELGFAHVAVLCTAAETALARRIAQGVGEAVGALVPRAVMHVPDDAVTSAVQEVRDCDADALVSIGGGSAVGLAKAVALETGLPIVAVPTTYAGSEMTPIWGRTSNGVKQTGRDRRVLPCSVIYDPELTLSLPAHISGVSGMNAIAHAVEALYAPDASPIVTHMALDGIRALNQALPRVVAAPSDHVGRAQALYGAWLCGACLGSVTMSLHHKLCHTLGGAFDLPHAETHAVMLPYVVAFNAAATEASMVQLASALDTTDPALALWLLGKALGAPSSLAALGLTGTDIDRAVTLATSNPYGNPVPVTEDGVRQLLLAALYGLEPRAAMLTPVTAASR
jgi:maleylacetate reductase